MRLDHLLSKEHTPRYQTTVLVRMVVFTSGIVDDASLWWAGSSQYCPHVPFRGWVWAWNLEISACWGGVGTLLSFEGSGDWLLVASWYPRAAGWWCWGLGGLVVCELDSGREHLTRQTYLPLVWGGCGCRVFLDVINSSLCSFC